MVSEIWKVTEFALILDHFLHFYPLTTQEIKILKKMKKMSGDIIILQVYHKKQYDVWFLRYEA